MIKKAIVIYLLRMRTVDTKTLAYYTTNNLVNIN